MRGAGFALQRPNEQSLPTLAEGDQLVRVRGGPSEFAISLALTDTGGRDLLVISHMTMHTYKRYIKAESLSSMLVSCSKKVACGINAWCAG